MKNTGVIYIAALLFLSACFLHNSTICAADKYGSFNIVFSVYGGCSYEEKENDYRLEHISELFSDDGFGAAKYYSATVEYSKSAYSEEEIIDIIKEREGFLEVSRDEVMYSEAVPDMRFDPYMQKQWYLDNINAYSAWDMLSKGPGENTVVAVIDSGVNYEHEDLRNNMWINAAEVYGVKGADDDGNGVADDIYGACFYTGDQGNSDVTGDPYDTDDNGHGTHVAGIIAMSGGNGGGRGIAYASKIMAVKAGGSDGKFLVSDVISAVNYAVKMGADVINMSFGAVNRSDVLESLLKKASQKSVLVAAAGNEQTSTAAEKMYPAAYPFVIGVMATDADDKVAEWSNYDTRDNNVITYDIAAPGVNIYSTVFDNKYRYMSGTSMAAPVVSAAAAVVYGSAREKNIADPAKYTFGQIVNSSAKKAVYKDGLGNEYTYPGLNLYSAVTEKPSLNMNVCGFNYKTSESGEVSSYLVSLNDEKGYIYCGYDIQNTWGAAKNVTVDMTTDSSLCRVVKGNSAAGDIDACGVKSVPCSGSDAMIIEFSGRIGEVYDIPVKYHVTGQTDGNSPVTVEQEYEDVIRVSLNQNTAVMSSNAYTLPAKSGAKSEKPAKVKKLRVIYKNKKGGKTKVKLKWNKADGAKKYVVYYSSKKNKGFKKLCRCKKTTCRHTFKGRKRYYYKVRAYAKSAGNKIYGKYSNTVRG